MADERLSYEEYRLLVEQAPILIWRADTNGQCDYFNQRWLEFTGRSLAQEKGEGWAQGVHPADLPGCLDTYLGCFNRRHSFEMVYRLRRHDGVYRWLFDRGAPFFDQEGRFAGFIGSCHDITERIEAQEALKKARESELYQLRGLLPICASCKRIRKDDGYWEQLETYISTHSRADFSHGLCPDCVRELYPELSEDLPG
ncbi:MAG: PAS domain S-box protein [Pseudomonadota bacterium]